MFDKLQLKNAFNLSHLFSNQIEKKKKRFQQSREERINLKIHLYDKKML